MNPQLENRHIVWIFDAAKESFEELIAKEELELMRHERFKD